MKTLQPEFVSQIPEKPEEGILYLALEYRLAVHLCICGCGNEVVTPFSPKDWKLAFDGETVSLEPSIGNWGFPCKSHYWIVRNEIHHARKWTDNEVDQSRGILPPSPTGAGKKKAKKKRWPIISKLFGAIW